MKGLKPNPAIFSSVFPFLNRLDRWEGIEMALMEQGCSIFANPRLLPLKGSVLPKFCALFFVSFPAALGAFDKLRKNAEITRR